MLGTTVSKSSEIVSVNSTSSLDHKPCSFEYFLTKDIVLSSLPENNSELKAAKKIATDYQDRKLFKCVFEKTISGKKTFGKNTLKQFRADIAKKSKLAENQIFIDTTTTHSMPLAPSKKESSSIILIKKEGGKITPQIIPISKIPLVSTMSGKMNILRAYTQQKNRNKVEMAAKSILGEL